MSKPESIKKIDKEFVRSIAKIESSTLEELYNFQNKIRFKIYKYLNKFMPRYLDLKTIDHRRMMIHMTHLKRQYAKTNHVTAIQGNLFKLGLMFGLVYIAVPQEVSSEWLKSIQSAFRAFKLFIKTNIKSIADLDSDEFFKSFVTFANKLLSIFFTKTIDQESSLSIVLLIILYSITMLFMVEIAVLFKILLLDGLEAI